MSIQRTNKTSWKVLFTLWFFSVFILCSLLLAAGSSSSGAVPRMFISFISNMGMLGAAGCSNRSERPQWDGYVGVGFKRSLAVEAVALSAETVSTSAVISWYSNKQGLLSLINKAFCGLFLLSALCFGAGDIPKLVCLYFFLGIEGRSIDSGNLEWHNILFMSSVSRWYCH